MIGTECSSRGLNNGHFENSTDIRCPLLCAGTYCLVETKEANETWRLT